MTRIGPFVQRLLYQRFVEAILAGSSIQVLEGYQPREPSGYTNEKLLVEFAIGDVKVDGGELVIKPEKPQVLIKATGRAGWMCIVDTHGRTIVDGDVGLTNSGADLEIDTVDLQRGGLCRIRDITLAIA